MGPWWQALLILCAVGLTIALVAAILALRQTLQRTGQLLATIERELRPTLEDLRRLTQEAQGATHDARTGVKRVVAIAEHVSQVTEGVGALVVGLRGLTYAGQIVGIAAGLRKGAEVFVRRLVGSHGGKHGQGKR